ncbi:hypothetical protein VTN96DRAFT_725 [Rasamsonia emersonii]|uniref:NmrA-like domain-containing protein n=1 Tax=Rasamsonia emersonii (strain ATCC 16479 / CBS 393.64 / IMI 116815) TaxID=1408163 RepID=A0A0F4Z4C8_RASE3|nr:hypothetical protein T310_1188 [Rasamsonia emersonii CBS 393.64]KKA24723.1 hypothetical protein T310_1188 [Rasamsonia emersonii CBS 393.64]
MSNSSFTPRNILLFGATGTIGRFILDAIVSARSEFDRVVVFTSSAAAAGTPKAAVLDDLAANKGVEVIRGDIADEKAVEEAYRGIDTVISCLGRTAIAAQIPLIKLAAAPGSSVRWFLPSEYGTDIKYGPSSAHEKPHQQKLKVRAYLEEDDAVRKSGLKYTYVVTGPYADMYMRGLPAGREAGGWDVRARKATLLERDAPVSLTTMKDVGTLVLATLRHPTASFNRALRVNSFTTTPAAIQAEFERQTGGSPWSDVQVTSLARLRELEQEAWDKSRPEATVLTLRRIWTEGGTLYEKRDNEVIGDPPMMTLEEIVAQLVKEAE